jgi:hypothetical protein
MGFDRVGGLQKGQKARATEYREQSSCRLIGVANLQHGFITSFCPGAINEVLQATHSTKYLCHEARGVNIIYTDR